MLASAMEPSLQVLLGLLLATALASASSIDLELGGRMCSDDFAIWQAKEFLSRFQRRSANHVQDWSRCTRPFWMDALASMSPEGTKVLFDIGCNKGYTSAYMFNVFAPQAGVSTKDIPTAMKSIGLEPSCGTCKDCEEKSEGLGPALMKSPQYNVQVHAFEPSTVNYGRLQKMKSTLFKGQDVAAQDGQRVSWILHNRAVADTPGTARFPTTCSTTKCSLAQGSNATTEVNVTTVDRVMLEQGINYIDVLKIDAEGYDPAVIRGAQRALREHKVGLLMYEYNDVGLWVNGDSLKGVTEFLGQLGYVCWLEGEQLTRLTGCWHDTLEFKMWSNVVCAWRRHPVFKVLNKRAFQRSSPGSTARVSRAASHMRQHQH